LPSYAEKRTSIEEQPDRRRVWRSLLVLFFFIVAVTPRGSRQLVLRLFSIVSEEADSRARNPAYPIKVEHGAVASENEVCSNLGVEILKEGGNAVDAAVATTFCIGVVNPFS